MYSPLGLPYGGCLSGLNAHTLPSSSPLINRINAEPEMRPQTERDVDGKRRGYSVDNTFGGGGGSYDYSTTIIVSLYRRWRLAHQDSVTLFATVDFEVYPRKL